MSKSETATAELPLDGPIVREETSNGLLLTRCGSCGTKVSREPGDVIFGGQWYHLNCWQNERRVSTESGEQIETLLLEEHKDYLRL